MKKQMILFFNHSFLKFTFFISVIFLTFFLLQCKPTIKEADKDSNSQSSSSQVKTPQQIEQELFEKIQSLSLSFQNGGQEASNGSILPQNSDVSIEVKNLPAEAENLIRVEARIQYFSTKTNRSELGNLDIADNIDNSLPVQKKATVSVTDKQELWLISAKVFFKKDNQWTAVNPKIIRSYSIFLTSNELNIHFDNGLLIKEGEDLKITLKNFNPVSLDTLNVSLVRVIDGNVASYYRINSDGSKQTTTLQSTIDEYVKYFTSIESSVVKDGNAIKNGSDITFILKGAKKVDGVRTLFKILRANNGKVDVDSNFYFLTYD